MARQGKAKPSKGAADLSFLTGCCFTKLLMRFAVNAVNLASRLDGRSIAVFAADPTAEPCHICGKAENSQHLSRRID